MKFLKIKSGDMFMGFSPVKGFKVVDVDSKNKIRLSMKMVEDFYHDLPVVLFECRILPNFEIIPLRKNFRSYLICRGWAGVQITAASLQHVRNGEHLRFLAKHVLIVAILDIGDE
jgi:hypothetical protein